MPMQSRASNRPPSMSYRLAALDRLFVVEWIGTPTAADVDRVIDALARETTQRGKVHSFVVIVSSRASMPDHDGRLAYLRNVDRTMFHCERLQIVLAGMPFINAFARGLVTTANVVPRYRGRVSIEDTLERCAAVLASELRRSPDELHRAITAALA